jgi:hypothetical protein
VLDPAVLDAADPLGLMPLALGDVVVAPDMPLDAPLDASGLALLDIPVEARVESRVPLVAG